jgi:aminoglycoside phosphotransferase (APT) family kinase protein
MSLVLEQATSRVPFLSAAKDLKYSRLSGGMTSVNYRIDADRDSYVLRVAGADTWMLGIRRDVECWATLRQGNLGARRKSCLIGLRLPDRVM